MVTRKLHNIRSRLTVTLVLNFKLKSVVAVQFNLKILSIVNYVNRALSFHHI